MLLRSDRLLLVLLVLVLAACSGSGKARDGGDRPEPLPTPSVQLSEYEDFDASPYADDAPGDAEAVAHDVPARLMAGQADRGVARTMQGFRVQIHSSLEKESAVQVEEEAKAWWRAQRSAGTAPANLFGNDLAIFVRYLQPYYRVRLGNFTSRAEAERARAYLNKRYPGAFIVPDTVTVTR